MTGIDDLSSGKLENIPVETDLRQIDIRDPELSRVIKEVSPDVVLHLAAQMSVAVSARNPILDADVNVLGSLNLLEGLRQMVNKKIKFVHFSSGGTVYGDPVDLPANEKSTVQPLSPYAASKLAIETYLPIYERLFAFQYAIIRLGNVYGPRQDPHGEAGVVAIFTRAMLENLPCKIFGDGNDERDYVFIDDVVDAVMNAINNSRSGPFNIATGIGTSPNKIFELISDMTDYSIPAIYEPPRPGDIHKIYLDISEAKRELEWNPKVPLEEGLKRTVDWFREN